MGTAISLRLAAEERTGGDLCPLGRRSASSTASSSQGHCSLRAGSPEGPARFPHASNPGGHVAVQKGAVTLHLDLSLRARRVHSRRRRLFLPEEVRHLDGRTCAGRLPDSGSLGDLTLPERG
jgi:hypothetical protein